MNLIFRIIIISILLSYSLKAQWSYSRESDPFDGEVKIVVGRGFDGRFPYESPRLVFRVKKNEREIYLDGAGSTACDENLVEFSFGDPNNVYSFDLTESTDSSAGFLNISRNELKILEIELVNQLMKANYVYVRFSSTCNSNRFKIPLRGSASALKNIYTNEIMNSYSPYSGNFSDFIKMKEVSKTIGVKFLNFNRNEISLDEGNKTFFFKTIEYGVEYFKKPLTKIEIEPSNEDKKNFVFTFENNQIVRNFKTTYW